MKDPLTHESFQALVDQPVSLQAAGIELAAKVAEVSVRTRHGDAGRDPFSVLLITESAQNHGQQIYTLKHPDLGELDLFLVPLGPREGGMCYEAIIT